MPYSGGVGIFPFLCLVVHLGSFVLLESCFCTSLQKKKGAEKKKSILELFKEELKRYVIVYKC